MRVVTVDPTVLRTAGLSHLVGRMARVMGVIPRGFRRNAACLGHHDGQDCLLLRFYDFSVPQSPIMNDELPFAYEQHRVAAGSVEDVPFAEDEDKFGRVAS